jgi:zinc/manganese transport system substrate-binding protein
MILTRVAVVSSLLVVGAACGGGGGGGGGGGDADADADAPVLATTSIWADISSGVGCGAEIPALIPAGSDPHTFEPSLRDREAVERATTVIANGLGLEESVVPMLDAAADGQGVNVIEMTLDVDVLTGDDDDRADEQHADEQHDDEQHDDEQHDDEHGHAEGGDPHVWQDPRRIAGTLDTIATALAANEIATCTDEYRAELVALDAEIEALLADLPDDARVLVTSHDSLAYFADRYGFEIVGTVIPSTSTLAETNAADLAELADAIEVRNVPAIFTEELESTADADALAERLGVRVVPIVTDSLTDDPATDTYVEMMRHNASLIAQALAP